MIGCLAKYIGRSGVLRDRLCVSGNGLRWVNKKGFADVGTVAARHEGYEFTSNK